MGLSVRTESLAELSAPPPSKSWLLAQALLGTRESGLHGVLQEAASARTSREHLAWLAAISSRPEHHFRQLENAEAQAREALTRHEQFLEDIGVQEGNWDAAKHPRRGGAPNAGWFATTGGGGGSGSAAKPKSFLDAVTQRNRTVAGLSGVKTPSMDQSSKLAGELDWASRLHKDVNRAAAAGLVTGGKAVANGSATSIKNVATLGLRPGQLELIGVTDEDRARGYDTAVSIATASGEVLIAVGTGGLASALAKGGTVAHGALVAYDAAGNAVGVVQGTYDAATDGVTVANGAQVAGGLLGLGANAAAAKSLTTPRVQPPVSPAPPTPQVAPTPELPTAQFRVGRHGEMPTPRPGQHSHHGVMSAWMERVFSSYDPKKAPAILMDNKNHRATYGVFNKWKGELARRSGGTFDWANVSEADMRALSEKMFDAAEVPLNVRQQYWTEFERMKATLNNSLPR